MEKMKYWGAMVAGLIIVATTVCTGSAQQPVKSKADSAIRTAMDTLKVVNLPKPYATRSVDRHSKTIGWPPDKAPVAPAGFTVTKFAEKLHNPRWIYVAPNGDIFVSEAKKGAGSANDILLFRDNNGDGQPDLKSVFVSGLNRPFGMLILDHRFYVANTDGILVYEYRDGQTRLTGKAKKILGLPAGGYNSHWTRNLMAAKDKQHIFVTVGSASNVGEYGMKNELRRACILEIKLDGSGERVYAGGLRNPQGMGFAPGTTT